jgi:peptidoglycan/LPS O-acetylase OafA/YrhL
MAGICKDIVLTHNGIDIDQYILFIIYPSIVFFGLGFIAKRKAMREPIKYALQGLTCIIFSIVYFVAVPNGGAYGLAIVLAVFGALLFFMARKYMIHPEQGQEDQTATSTKEI